MTTKAFIFDMDGVIIDSESWWDKLSFKDTGHSIGRTITSAFQETKKTNSDLSWGKFFADLNNKAKIIYNQAPLTKNIDWLISWLIQNNFHLGIVSGSTTAWINMVMARLKQPIPLIISLQDRQELKPKPAPDGYLAAIKQLGTEPKNTVILEDSQTGIDSAKASGAYTICLTELHPKNYRPEGADLYVKNIAELLSYLDSIQV